MIDDVSRETREILKRYEGMLRQGATEHNLIATSTVPEIWQRHIVDSAQLVPLAEGRPGTWLDIGSGAGLPGLVAAILRPTDHTLLIEPRKLRATFLQCCSVGLALTDRVEVHATRVEAVATTGVAVISARAVSSLDVVFGMGHRFAGEDTIWLLPKGRSAEAELAEARKSWHGDFRVMPSMTDPTAGIVIARRVQPRSRR